MAAGQDVGPTCNLMDVINPSLHRVQELLRASDEGQGMIEYGLLVALISIVAIVVVTAIGGGLTSNFQSVLNAL
jgi:pilus assembly protein Flp/PilA